jgi:hypothetical protein
MAWRQKSIGVQSNIDGLLLDKAVEYFAEEAEHRWGELVKTIHSPTSIGKLCRRLEADLDWVESQTTYFHKGEGESDVNPKAPLRLRKSAKLSKLFEERITTLRSEFDAEIEQIRTRNVELQAEMRAAEARAHTRESELQSKNLALVAQLDELKASNAALSQQLKFTLSLHSAAPLPTQASSSTDNSSSSAAIKAVGTETEAPDSIDDQMNLLRLQHKAEMQQLQQQNAALASDLETKDFLLERKDRLMAKAKLVEQCDQKVSKSPSDTLGYMGQDQDISKNGSNSSEQPAGGTDAVSAKSDDTCDEESEKHGNASVKMFKGAFIQFETASTEDRTLGAVETLSASFVTPNPTLPEPSDLEEPTAQKQPERIVATCSEGKCTATHSTSQLASLRRPSDAPRHYGKTLGQFAGVQKAADPSDAASVYDTAHDAQQWSATKLHRPNDDQTASIDRGNCDRDVLSQGLPQRIDSRCMKAAQINSVACNEVIHSEMCAPLDSHEVRTFAESDRDDSLRESDVKAQSERRVRSVSMHSASSVFDITLMQDTSAALPRGPDPVGQIPLTSQIDVVNNWQCSEPISGLHAQPNLLGRPPRPAQSAVAEISRPALEVGKRGRSRDRRHSQKTAVLSSVAPDSEEVTSTCSTRSGASREASSIPSGRSGTRGEGGDSVSIASAALAGKPTLQPLSLSADREMTLYQSKGDVNALHENSRSLSPCLKALRCKPVRQHSVNLDSDFQVGKVDRSDTSPRSASCTRLDAKQAANKSICLRVVSSSGITCYGGPPNSRSLLTPRATAGIRKLPRPPDARRELSEDFAGRSCELDVGTHSIDERWVASIARQLPADLHVQGMHIHERAERVLVV